MVNFFNNRNLRSAVLLTSLCSFFLGATFPLNASPFEMKKNGFDETAFVIRMEKLIKKLKKQENKTTKDILKAVINIKEEIELSTGNKFKIDDVFDHMTKRMQENGCNLSNDKIENFKKAFKKENKKRKNHSVYVADMIASENYQFDECGQMLDYEAKHHEQKEDIEIPNELAFGISCCLGGAFLECIPWGWTQYTGGLLLTTGSTAILHWMYTGEEKHMIRLAIA